ncbi:MAG: hypothetical protein KKD01_09885 [Proteobacteria bacterium]|nr:hypothetical protein [Pseudomonadota bacterium]MBU1140754.1 hypothetical protein [Pseudomonadota bacterium]MBU1231456.1 hypothetical protein [Pseudomonadota bacterium]MBU1420719.1 hypothetical protein [Pseudomonadota bacterium]MBU1455022.1 hypothetical protein [Pseudomonadota bacterium]
MENSIDQKKRVISMGRGIFILLAVGILPILFMNPGQFFFGLVVCYGIAFGLAWVLV